MGEAEKIIEYLQKQTSSAEIEANVDWSSLSQGDYETLLSEAELMYGSRMGYDLLGLIFKAIKDKDYWLEIRVLAQVILRPENELDKSKLLKRMAYCLEEVGNSLNRIPKTDPLQVKYRRYLCDYVFLSARLLDYAGDLDHALIEYQAAQKAYSEYNYLDLAKELDEPIARLQRLKRQGDQLFSLQSIVDHREQFDKEFLELTQKAQLRFKEIEDFNTLAKIKESELMSLGIKIKDLDAKYQAGQKVIQKLKDEASSLESQIQEKQINISSIENEKGLLLDKVADLNEQIQQLDIRVAQTTLKLNDRLAALQSQIDLKESELEKVERIINKKKLDLEELDLLISQRHSEVQRPVESLQDIVNGSAEVTSVDRKTEEAEEKINSNFERQVESTKSSINLSSDELAEKLERYKQSLKATRGRKNKKNRSDSGEI